MKSTTKTIEKYIAKLDSRYSLHYVDYRDSLDEKHHDAIVHEAIQKNSRMPIEETTCEWYDDDYEAVRSIIAETYTDKEQERIEEDEDLHQSIVDAIRERDDSDVVSDLMRNTGSRYFFYSLGIEIPEGAEIKDVMRELNGWKKSNGAKWKITKEQMSELIANAFYGGSLGFLFRLDSFALVTEPHEYERMKLDQAQLACIDYVNGSGYDLTVEEVVLPLFKHRHRIGIEHYYVNDVCGMSLDESSCTFEGKREWSEVEPEKHKYSTSSVGNIMADDITMLHVRSWNETKCNGQTYEHGHLFRFDTKDRNAPTHVVEALKMSGGWLAKIKEVTPTENYVCAWVAFDSEGNVVAKKIERARGYVMAYCEHIKEGTTKRNK